MEARKDDGKTMPLEVIQAALDRHRIAEAEFLPLERRILQFQNAAEKMWTNAPSMPNAGGLLPWSLFWSTVFLQTRRHSFSCRYLPLTASWTKKFPISNGRSSFQS